MRLRRSNAHRVAIVSAASAIMGMLVGIVALLTLPVRPVRIVTEAWVTSAFGSRIGELCERDSVQWVWGDATGFQFSVEPESLLVTGVGTFGAVKGSMLREIEAGATAAYSSIPPLSFKGGESLVRVRSGGRCAFVYSRWHGLGGLARTVGSWTIVAAIAALGLGGLLGGVLVARPLTRRVEQLAELAAHVGDGERYGGGKLVGGGGGKSAEPEDEVDVVAHALVAAHERIVADQELLKRGREQLQRHINNLAHDLKTPLTSMFMAVEQLREEMGDEQVTELVDGMLADTVYVASLVDNLNLAAMFSGDLTTLRGEETFDLAECAERVVRRYRLVGVHRRMGCELRREAGSEGGVMVRGNGSFAEQALRNLVQNAVMYATAGGVVTVRVGARDGRFRVRVDDEGEGVSAAELERLGEPGFRGFRAVEAAPFGAGMGVAIVRQVVAMHGWELTLANKVPRGFVASIEGACGDVESGKA